MLQPRERSWCQDQRVGIGHHQYEGAEYDQLDELV